MGPLGLRISALAGVVSPFMVYGSTQSLLTAAAIAVVFWPIAYFAAKDAKVMERQTPPER
jgi:hypothetical protein